MLTWQLLDTMCAQECGHWADALKEVRKEGFCRKRQTEEVEVETENSSRFQTGLQRLDAKVVLTEKKKLFKTSISTTKTRCEG